MMRAALSVLSLPAGAAPPHVPLAPRRGVGRHRLAGDCSSGSEVECELARPVSPMGANLLPAAETEPSVSPHPHLRSRHLHDEASSAVPREVRLAAPAMLHAWPRRRGTQPEGCRNIRVPVATRHISARFASAGEQA